VSAPADAPFVVAGRRGFWLGRGAVAAVFAGVCGASVRYPSLVVAITGVVGAVMFGALALFALRECLRRGPRLTLDRRGVEVPGLGIGVIAWDRIAAVEAFGSNEAPFLAFHVREPDAFLAQLPRRARLVARWLRAQGLPVLSVHLIGIDRPVDEVAQRARAFWRAGAEPPGA
jgi:hypothetical protein